MTSLDTSPQTRPDYDAPADSSHEPPADAAACTLPHSVWGLDPLQLHIRHWAARGVQVVRQGEPSQIVRQAELFLLTDPRSLVLFPLAASLDALNWARADLVFVRLIDPRQRGYREYLLSDQDDRLVGFHRLYDVADFRLTRVALTPDRDIAMLWQSAPDTVSAIRRLRRVISPCDRAVVTVRGDVFDRTDRGEQVAFLSRLMNTWKRPDATIPHIRQVARDVWAHADAEVKDASRLVGPLWIGAGRTISAGDAVVGPAVVWDHPRHRPPLEPIDWLEIEPAPAPDEPEITPVPPFSRAIKRLFDILFSLVALTLTLPLYPLIMFAILLEDGRPFFFSHRRETLGGREFGCLKFRSMRKDAERIKQELLAARVNQADGPQFYMENDPRLTRVGTFLRKYNLDELPQFINVVRGDMSVVGPRPSPRSENQYCPGWREARLSVRPGITGLWQVMRTRRAGSDFQEWIKFDLQYVENRSFWLDLVIIARTITGMLRKAGRI